jgi:NADH dehydrogenase
MVTVTAIVGVLLVSSQLPGASHSLSALGPLFIDGANGYLGSHLVQMACDEGYDVHALVRPGTCLAEQELLRRLGAKVFLADLKGPEDCSSDEKVFLNEAFASCVGAIHLIGSIAPKKSETFSGLHQGKALAFGQWCKLAQIERVVMVTALGASPKSGSEYLSSKYQAEETMRQLMGDKLAILRPSLIVGRAVGKRDSKLVKRYLELIVARPMVPLIDGGGNLLQPVDVRDLSRAILGALAAGRSGVLEIGGSRVLTMRAFVIELMRQLGVNKPILALPAVLASGLASLLEVVQAVPLISKDQAFLARFNNVCLKNELESLLDYKPRSLEESLSTYRQDNLL